MFKRLPTLFHLSGLRRSRRRRRGHVAAIQSLEPRQLLAAVLTNPVDDVSLDPSGSANVALGDHFDDPDVSVVEIASPLGSFQIATYDVITPVTAQNFITLSEGGNYTDMFLHRSDPGFVVQGGGFTYAEGGSGPISVTNNGTIVNEFDNWFDPELGGLAEGTPLNLRGTVAMAKQANNPDSATSQWFVSLDDNSGILDPQNGGFTVFGRVVGDGMDVVDAIAGLDLVNAGSPFNELPVRGEVGQTILRENLVTTTTTVVNDLTYQVTANSNEAVVTTEIVDGELSLTAVEGVVGTSFITLVATDVDGGTVTEVIEVAVGVPHSSEIQSIETANATRQPTFTWSEVAEATGYELWVNQIGGTAAIVREQNLTTATFTQSEDLPYGRYKAWVRTSNETGNGAWSPAFEFGYGLEPVTVTSPSTGFIEDLRPRIEWTASSQATEYDVWVNQVGGTSQVIRTTTSETFLVPEFDLVAGETYRVWVQAQAGAGEAEWSAAVNFTISASLEFTAPAATSSKARPEFVWTGDAGKTYELWVNASGGTATKVIHETSVSGASFTPGTDLDPGHYRAWVRERPTAGSPGPWSDAYSFAISTGAPNKGEIAAVSDAAAGQPRFEWSTLQNADHYELWVNDLTTGTSRVIHERELTGTEHTAAETLGSGSYRAWIRGFSALNEPGPWSDAVDFTV